MSVINLSDYEALGYDSKEELLEDLPSTLIIDEPLEWSSKPTWTDERYLNY